MGKGQKTKIRSPQQMIDEQQLSALKQQIISDKILKHNYRAFELLSKQQDWQDWSDLSESQQDPQEQVQVDIEKENFPQNQHVDSLQNKGPEINSMRSVQESSILQSKDEYENLTNFFQKKVKSASLVFKASQHEFKLEKFFDFCGNLNNLVILCQTTNNKKIGGFTPLSFNPIKKESCGVEDKSSSSFLFSLTENDKFIFTPQLQLNKWAIYRNVTKKVLSFGRNEFLIHTQNINSLFTKPIGYSHLNRNYFNQKYMSQDPESFKKFNGQINNKFMIQQWQAFHVYFDESTLIQQEN